MFYSNHSVSKKSRNLFDRARWRTNPDAMAARICRLVMVVFLTVFVASAAKAEEWGQILKKAKNQTVYFNAWGGAGTINNYIAWVGRQAKEKYGVTLKHVKVGDATEYITRVQADYTAGKTRGGGVDLVWINGENFKRMKDGKLLYGPFAEKLPNRKYLDIDNKPSLTSDFTVPVDGYESPWGVAQIVFVYDTAITSAPPRSAKELLRYAKKNPGRITYPRPPNFVGTTFLKQILYGLVEDISVFQKPPGKDAAKVTAGLWEYLAEIRPYLWRKGKVFPKDDEEQRQLLNDTQIDLSLTFSPGGPSSHILRGNLPKTTKTYVFERGTIGNAHFVAIPFNAAAREGAMVVANFLLSPEAQLEKQKPTVWGDFTVLAMAKISNEDRIKFKNLDLGPATLSPVELGKALPEPHPDWTLYLESEWKKRH